jgi:glycosyltransferase involved in cell wall biosynthesis
MSEIDPSATALANDAPLVSVVMPAYNSARYIAQALDSALEQDYPALEIVVVDDGSTDDTVNIVTRYGDKVRLLSQKNQGSAAARNFGIREARGKYIAFLDADDAWWPHKIRHQVAAMIQGGYKMAYSRFIWWHPDAHGQHTQPETEFAQAHNPNLSSAVIVTGWTYAELLLDCIVWTSTVIVEKTEIEKAGFFDETLRKGQDYDLWLKLSRQVEMAGLEIPTALYRIHPASITSSVKEINYEYLILSRAVDRWSEAGPDGRMPPQGLVAARLAKSSFGHGHAHLKYGSPRIAAESLRLSMQHSGVRVKTVALWCMAKLKQIAQSFTQVEHKNL